VSSDAGLTTNVEANYILELLDEMLGILSIKRQRASPYQL